MKTLKNSMIVGILLIATTMMSQNQEVEFDVYSNSAAKASRYLLADNVALRDCPSAQCEQLTTLKIGTYVRLLAKSETPQTINDVCSRWYKIKMGPQIGWIWGGLISQKTMTSSVDPETKFVFGEAGENTNSQKQYEIRAIKNGVELDKIVFKADALLATSVRIDGGEQDDTSLDVIRMLPTNSEEMIVVWEHGYFSLLNTGTVSVSD